MAQMYVTGPVWIFLRFRDGGQGYRPPVYLGTAERSPRIRIQRSFDPVYADVSGNQEPMEDLYDGQSAVIIADLTRHNALHVQAMQDTTGLDPRDTWPREEGLDKGHLIGAAAQRNRRDFEAFFYFPYAYQKPFHYDPVVSGMTGGYRFPSLTLVGPDELDGLGPLPMKCRCVWRARRKWVLNQSVSPARMDFLLFDHDITNYVGAQPD